MISILITNYNKEKYLNKNLNLLFKSSIKNFEIILFDDVSTDNSIKIIEKFKNVKIIKNKKKKFTSPALNQIFGILACLKKANGELICLLDADDFFKKNKLKVIREFFVKNKNKNCVYNFPITNINKFKYKKKKSNNIWPTIFPTSCISIRKKAMIKFVKYLKPNSFPNLEIDARLNIFMKFYLNEYNVIKKKLTKYNDDEFGITSNIPKFSKKWWFRRMEAYNYMQFILQKKNNKFKITPDYLLTRIISKTCSYFF